MPTRRPPTRRDTCGEYRGFQAHHKAGEDACGDCVEARNTYMRNYRRRTGLTKGTLYTPEQIADLQAAAVTAALAARRHPLRRRASRGVRAVRQ
jgi:hypothetical protein